MQRTSDERIEIRINRDLKRLFVLEKPASVTVSEYVLSLACQARRVSLTDYPTPRGLSGRPPKILRELQEAKESKKATSKR